MLTTDIVANNVLDASSKMFAVKISCNSNLVVLRPLAAICDIAGNMVHFTFQTGKDRYPYVILPSLTQMTDNAYLHSYRNRVLIITHLCGQNKNKNIKIKMSNAAQCL